MKIVFMGTPQAAAVSLAALLDAGHDVVAVYTQPDRPAGRGNKLHASAVKEFAVASGLSVFQPEKIRTEEALAEFRAHSADIAVVVAYGRILPETWLNAFPRGAVNVHFSLLPLYRGAAPVNWAIADGETVTGVTTMNMDAGLDTGDILLQSSVSIEAAENALELMAKLSDTGAELLIRTLEQYDSIVPDPQVHAAATHAPILKKEDGRVDFSRNAADIANRVRGFQPFPSSYTQFRGKRLTIWKCSAASEFESEGSVLESTIVAAKADELVVACGSGTFLSVEELQLEGKKRSGVRDFINGLRPTVGEHFGE